MPDRKIQQIVSTEGGMKNAASASRSPDTPSSTEARKSAAPRVSHFKRASRSRKRTSLTLDAHLRGAILDADPPAQGQFAPRITHMPATCRSGPISAMTRPATRFRQLSLGGAGPAAFDSVPELHKQVVILPARSAWLASMTCDRRIRSARAVVFRPWRLRSAFLAEGLDAPIGVG
jgi:hypothetical protein